MGFARKSQTTLTSQQTADANEALVKIANATSCKIPELAEKQANVKQVLRHVKKYASAKKNAWRGSGLYECFKLGIANAGRPLDKLMEGCKATIMNEELNLAEHSEFIESLSDQIQFKQSQA